MTPEPVDATIDTAMDTALDEARLAETEGEVPVGAVIVIGGEIVALDHNRRESTSDPSAHAELLALRAACAAAGSWRLPGATVVVTLEPCAMCAGALSAARVERVVFGAADPKAGALGSLYNLGADPRLPHTFDVTPGLRAAACGELLEAFFVGRRTPG
ncbi:MAG: nucleoside deaminase [Acidimicrobiales bacterium]|nr:nucleoside deaminase [Acidimicrobiales bacterium]